MKSILLIAQPKAEADADTAAIVWRGFAEETEKLLAPAKGTRRILEHAWQIPAEPGLSALAKIAQVAGRVGVRLAVHISPEALDFSSLP